MTQQPGLLSAIDLRQWTTERWQALVDVVDRLDEGQWTTQTDVAGWSIKDHVAHVTRWDESLVALVTRRIPRQVTLMVPDLDWNAGGYDAMNEAIRQQTITTPVAEVCARRDATWSELSALLDTFDDETLQRPGKDFGLDYGRNETFLETLVDDLGVHYDQHRQYIERIIASSTMTTTEEYRALADQRWAEFTAFLDGLSEEDWTRWTDAKGWTVKDHVAHVQEWDSAWNSQAIGGPSQREWLAVPNDVWERGVDAINAWLRQRSLGLTAAQVRANLDAQIDNSRANLANLDLTREARDLGLAPPHDDRSLLVAFTNDQAEHYEEHHRYMDRIVDQGRAAQEGA